MPDWLRRLGFRSLVAALWLGTGYYALFGGEYSVRDLRELQQERDAVAARLDSVRERADSVSARADALARDTLVIQRTAREEHGLIRDGEILYRFVPAAADSARSR